jgi:hypothetical protein
MMSADMTKNRIWMGVVFCCLGASVARADWPMLGHDAGRSGATAAEIRPPFGRKWYRAFPDEGIMAGVQPIVAGKMVFLGSLKGILHAMDAQTGRDVWTFQAGGPILHACAAAEGKVFFGAADGGIYAVNVADGKLAWTVRTGQAIWNAPIAHEGLVIIGGRDGKLYACEAATGKARWIAPIAGPILCSPAIDVKRGRVYVGGEDMRIYAFDLADGKPIWQSDKLPGVSFRGYHPVIAPDGSVMMTCTPCAGGDAIQQIMLDMVKEVFGDFASWRHKKEENDRLRRENFELMKRPETYQKQLDYLRKRLTDQSAYQTFFVLDPATGKQKFIAPIVYAESMNGPGAPPVVTPAGQVIVKYSALLRSRYEHYSPFLNVGYLDTATGHITPVMDQTRTYGWNDSLLLVHDEQCQLAVGGRVLFNTHQDNVNAMDLDTLKGYGGAMCHNVHEVQPGTANALWSIHLSGKPLPMGWEWFARGTAVYGGGSAIDTSIVIDDDSFYFLPTHEINAGVVVLAYRMDPQGNAATRAPEPKEPLTAEQWRTIKTRQWDWDILGMPRLDTVLKAGLPEKVPGTREAPLGEDARKQVGNITDAQLDQIIWEPAAGAAGGEMESLRQELTRAVDELISSTWRPLVFPGGKHPAEAYRFFGDPSETLYTLALAYPHLSGNLQQKVKAHVEKLTGPGGPLAGAAGVRSYAADVGQVRSAYMPAPDALLRIGNDLLRSDTARLYPLWLWASVSGDWRKVEADWPAIKPLVRAEAPRDEMDCGNGRLAGLIAACRIARKLNDEATVNALLPQVRAQMRLRLVYELSHTEGGVMTRPPTLRTIFGRWRNLTPDVARLLQLHAGDIHRHLVEVYVDHHRPTWWLAWNVELMWRNECPFIFPTASLEVFSAKAMILREPAAALAGWVDLPWCKGDEFFIQKLAMTLNNP